MQTPPLPPHLAGGTPLLFVTPETLQTLACLVDGTPLLATPGAVLELICEWFWGLQAEPVAVPLLPTRACRTSCLRCGLKPPCPAVFSGTGRGYPAASETSFNRGIFVPNPLTLFTPLAGCNKSLERREEATSKTRWSQLGPRWRGTDLQQTPSLTVW